MRNDISEYGLKTESEISGANKVMEAKIVDLDDKLRLGMAKMQVVGYLDINEYWVLRPASVRGVEVAKSSAAANARVHIESITE